MHYASQCRYGGKRMASSLQKLVHQNFMHRTFCQMWRFTALTEDAVGWRWRICLRQGYRKKWQQQTRNQLLSYFSIIQNQLLITTVQAGTSSSLDWWESARVWRGQQHAAAQPVLAVSWTRRSTSYWNHQVWHDLCCLCHLPPPGQVQPWREQMDRDIRNSPRTPLWIPRLCQRKFGQFKKNNSLHFDTNKDLSCLRDPVKNFLVDFFS